ncbi:MAG: hypothetical protein IKJ68_02020 [Clostridia bacterium]|nr:hypothetical protein [Clostridia bacterium]
MNPLILLRVETNPVFNSYYIELFFNKDNYNKDFIFINSVRLINNENSPVNFDGIFPDKWIPTPLKKGKYNFSVKFKDEIKAGFRLFISVKYGRLGKNENYEFSYDGSFWHKYDTGNPSEVT